MDRFKVFIYFLFFFIATSTVAQPVDTITFQFIPDIASTYKVRCQAQKVYYDIDAGDTTFRYVDFELTDTVGSAYTFNWGGAKEPVVDGLPVANYEFTDTGTYAFSLSVYEDATGETFIESATYPIRDFIRVPNVFTPNGDGVNDLFIVRANGIDPLEITIFSRTGTKVFSTKSPIIVWDGRNSSGSMVSEGVYYYILTSQDPNIPVQKGFIHLFDPEKGN